MYPRLSIIVPCFNQGHYLKDALGNLSSAPNPFYEVIIVNDGSTDPETIKVLQNLANQGFTVLNQENKGLAGARNTGIDSALGEYIVPLDSDNKLRLEVVRECMEMMDADASIDVMYGNGMFFGESSGIWKNEEFNLQKLMIQNYIDACAIIRKSTIYKVGLYDRNMIAQGWEDWDLWLRLAFGGFKFKYIDSVFFDYRIVSNSMSKTLYATYEKPNKLENYIHQKYPDKMGHQWIWDHVIKRFKKNPFLFIVKLILRTYFPGKYRDLLNKHKIRNGI